MVVQPRALPPLSRRGTFRVGEPLRRSTRVFSPRAMSCLRVPHRDSAFIVHGERAVERP